MKVKRCHATHIFVVWKAGTRKGVIIQVFIFQHIFRLKVQHVFDLIFRTKF